MVLNNYQIEDSDLAISTTTGEGNANVLVLSRDGIVALRMPLGDAGIVAMQDNNQYVFTGRQYNNQGRFQLKIPVHEEDHVEYSYQLYFNNFLVCDFAVDVEIDGAPEFYTKLLQIGGLVEVEEEEEEEEDDEENEEDEDAMNQSGGRRSHKGRKTKRARRRRANKRSGTRKSQRR